MKRFIYAIGAFILIFKVSDTYSQQTGDSTLANATLENCVSYALTHQPAIRQSLIDQEITERQIKSKLADWYPQINFDGNYQHNFQLQKSKFGDQIVQLGTDHTSALQFSLNQNLFNRDVLLASKSAGDVRKQAKQTTSSNKIDIGVSVSKAFYDVLLSQQQIKVLDEDIVRLERSLKDAYNQYQGGIVDKVDYKRATISLNNTKAQKKSSSELMKAKLAYLKQQMGYPDSLALKLQYDSVKMEQSVAFDTSAMADYQSRIEYQLLQTQQRLLQANLKYYKWSYIPTVSAFASYNVNYLDNSFGKLYSTSYPNSYAGVKLNIPIFQGMKRVHNIKQAELQLKRLDYDFISLKNQVNTEYETALASYKSNYNDYVVLKDNLELARDVYNTIQLQYKSGIKTYLEVITAETDLRTSQLNYTNALYQVLSSKLDVQKALGAIQY